MEKEVLFTQLKEIIVDVLDERELEINMEDSLRDLGANSIDRVDILIEIMTETAIEIPVNEFANLKNIQGIVDMLYSRANKV